MKNCGNCKHFYEFDMPFFEGLFECFDPFADGKCENYKSTYYDSGVDYYDSCIDYKK